MIDIDGSFGEGGGQILRSALTLSLITGKPFHLRKIRASRKPKPGLQPQHLASVRAAATIGSAKVSGDSLGSSDLAFHPGPVAPGKYRFPIGTAGATGLLLQTIYLPLAWKQSDPSEVIIEGGTHVTSSPCFHFLDVTWRVYLKKMGLKLALEMKRPGFYPRGGGSIVPHIQPCQALHGLNLTREIALESVTGFSRREFARSCSREDRPGAFRFDFEMSTSVGISGKKPGKMVPVRWLGSFLMPHRSQPSSMV